MRARALQGREATRFHGVFQRRLSPEVKRALSHLQSGEYIRCQRGRSPISKWVYSKGCQAFKQKCRAGDGGPPPLGTKFESSEGDTFSGTESTTVSRRHNTCERRGTLNESSSHGHLLFEAKPSSGFRPPGTIAHTQAAYTPPVRMGARSAPEFLPKSTDQSPSLRGVRQ